MTTAASSTAVSVTASPTAEADRRRRVGRRLAELDALRALMVLVVMFHALQASKGDVDVRALRDMSVGGVILGNIDVLLPIFFILSGFAVYYQLGAAVLQGKPLPASRTWLFKRALRLLPVYYLVFILVWVWRYGGSTMQWEDLAWGGLLMQTWSTDHIFRTIDPGWYLSVEWHFALVVALAVLPWFRMIAQWPLRSRIAGLLVPPLVLAAITLWWRITLRDARVPGDQWGAWFAPPSWALMYGVGMLLGLALLLRPVERWQLPRPASLLMWVGSTAGLIYLQSRRGADEFATLWYFQISTFLVIFWLIAAITADPDTRMRRFMRSRPVQGLAAASFVTYIVHAPVLRSLAARDIFPLDVPQMWWVSAAAITIVSLGLGYLAHRYIELPLASLEKVLAPKIDRVAKAVKATRPTVLPGSVLPDAVVQATGGEELRLRELPAGRPLLLLVHPDGPIPKDRRLQGASGAVRTLDGVRAAAASRAFRLATLSPAPEPVMQRGGASEADGLPPLLRLVDPGSRVATQIGVGTVTTADRRVLPEILMLVVDPAGTITHVLRDPDPHLLLHRALSAIDQQAGVTGVYQRRTWERPAQRAPVPQPQAGEV